MQRWTVGEIMVLTEAWQTKTAREITGLLPLRSSDAVKLKAEALKLKRQTVISEVCRACDKRFTYVFTGIHKTYCSRECGNRAFQRERRRRFRRKINLGRSKLRAQVVKYLGGKCISCGITDVRVLQINHVHGNGYKDLRNHEGMHRQIVNGKRPGDFDLRCANCNLIYEHARGRRKLTEYEGEIVIEIEKTTNSQEG